MCEVLQNLTFIIPTTANKKIGKDFSIYKQIIRLLLICKRWNLGF